MSSTQPTQDPKSCVHCWCPIKYRGKTVVIKCDKCEKLAPPTTQEHFTQKLAKEVATYKDKELLTPATKPLDEQTEELCDYLQYDDGETTGLHYAHLAEIIVELRQAIANAEKQARIDELQKISGFSNSTGVATMASGRVQSIADRIKELEGNK